MIASTVAVPSKLNSAYLFYIMAMKIFSYFISCNGFDQIYPPRKRYKDEQLKSSLDEFGLSADIFEDQLTYG